MTNNDEETRKAIARAYMRMWEAKNSEHRKAYARARYAKNREAILEANRARVDVWHKENPEARREHKRRYREKNREKLREANRQYVKGESGNYKEGEPRRAEKKRQSMVDLAGRPRPEVCEACGGPPDPKKGLHFDHCHRNGHFRGWICRGCNLALGNVSDDIGRLRKLVAYLERTKDGPVAQFSFSGV